MDGLSANEDSMDAAPKGLLGGVVTKVHRTPQLSELCTGAMQARPPSGGAQTLEQEGRRSIVIVDGRGDTQEFGELGMNYVQINIPSQDRLEPRNLRPITGHMQPLMAHVVQSGAQVESQ